MPSLPPEDQPPEEWRRFTTDEEAAAALPRDGDLTNPVQVALLFCDALDDPSHYRNALLRLTTPESHGAWGNFAEAARFLSSIKDLAYGSRVNEAVGAPDVVYFKLIENGGPSYQIVDAQPIPVAGLITLVWRPEYDGWKVHAMGAGPALPDDVPRTA